MANLNNLFPNLTGIGGAGASDGSVEILGDFINAPAALGGDERSTAEIAAGRQKVENWARHGSSDLIPSYKLPNIAIGDVHTLVATDGLTTDDDGVISIADIIAILNSDANLLTVGHEVGTANAFDAFHEGDVVIATGTTNGGTLGDGATLTFLYTNGAQAGLTPGDGAGFAAGDFHEIASSATGGVTSLTANNSLTVNQSTGAVQIELDDNIHAKIGSASFVVGRNDDGETVPTLQSTSVIGNSISIDSETSATVDGQTGVTVLSGGGAVALRATDTTNGNVTVTAGNDFTATVTGDTTIGGANISVGVSGDSHVDITASGVLVDGTLTIEDLSGAAGTDAVVGDDILVVNGSGVVSQRNLANLGGGRYTVFNTIVDGATGTIQPAQHNGVVLILAQAAATNVTIDPPADASETGHWIKLINNSGRTDVTLTGTFLETTDNTIVLDDSSANFELIWTGTNGWALITT